MTRTDAHACGRPAYAPEPDPRALIREMEHRIKNHLQMLAAYTKLAGAGAGTTPQQLAEDVSQKLMAIASAHEALHAGGGRESVFARPFLRMLRRPYETAPHLIDVVCDPALQMSASQLGPVGMIASEALSNAVKHAFPRGRTGLIELSLERSASLFELIVRDDGEGLPATAAPFSGRTLIQTFARQLAGTSFVGPAPGGGVEVRVVFPA